MVQGEEAALKFFVTHEQFTEAVEPAMTNLDDPSACLLGWAALLRVGLLAATHHVGDVAMRNDGGMRRSDAIAGIRTQVLVAPARGPLALDHHGLQHGIELGDVKGVGLGDDEGQGDAMPVHQKVTLAALFSPGPWGWDPQPLAPGAL